jgi:hypothetical protein
MLNPGAAWQVAAVGKTGFMENEGAKTDKSVGKRSGVMAIPGQLPKMAMIRTVVAADLGNRLRP